MGWRFECLCVAGFGEFGDFGVFGEWSDGSVSEWWRLVVAVHLGFVSVDVVSCLGSFVVVVVRREVLQRLDPCALLR